MKYISTLLIFISTNLYGAPICSDYSVSVGDANHWAESDFNEKSARDAMQSINHALENKGAIGDCELPNALAIVEGYVLKLRAQNAPVSKDAPESTKNYDVYGFCEFIKNAKPCE